MENRRTLVVTGLLVLVILLLIGGTVWYILNFIRSRQNATNTSGELPSATEQNASPSSVAGVSTTPSSTPLAANTSGQSGNNLPSTGISSDTKLYTGTGFQLEYPKTWGLLTCNDSKNFEFDPLNGTDKLNIVCDYAVKPITVLVGNKTGCGGTTTTIGTVKVQKKVTTTSTGVNYQWCTVGIAPVLNITHRVSSAGKTATSTKDYSKDIEQMISTFRDTTLGGS